MFCACCVAVIRTDRIEVRGSNALELASVTYFVSTRWGGDERDVTIERMREILSELDAVDIEHPNVALTHETEWALGVYSKGLVIWENVERDNEPRHMNEVSRDRVLDLWIKLSAGKITEIDTEPWLPGYEDAV